jgi:hypothetical protein
MNEKPKKWIEALIWEFLRVWEWKWYTKLFNGKIETTYIIKKERIFLRFALFFNPQIDPNMLRIYSLFFTRL